MSYYEKAADKTEYSYFVHREITLTLAHLHSAVEFLFVERGSQQVVLNGEKFTVNAGEGCFYDSFSVHSYENYSGAVGYILLGARECFENFFNEHGGKTPPRVFKYDNFELLKSLHANYDKKYNDARNKKTAFLGAINILLSDIAEKNQLVISQKTKHASLICDILAYADKNYTSDLSLGFIANKFGYSKEHLSRVIKKYLSEPWNQYVNRLRVKRAKLMLDNSDIYVTDAAIACGFDNVNTFYTAFKKVFGRLPRTKD